MKGILRNAAHERRSGFESTTPQNPADWLIRIFGGLQTTSGVKVNAGRAIGWTPLASGIRLLATTQASLPIGVFEHLEPRGKKPRSDHPTYALLHDEPNPEQTAYEFTEMLATHIELFGNGYSQIVRNGRGEVMELWPLNPDRVRLERDNHKDLVYRVSLPRDDMGGVSGSTVLPRSEVLHIRGWSLTGLLGLLLVDQFQEAIGLGLATEIYAAAFFGRGTHAGGMLQHPGKLSKEAQGRLRESVEKQAGGIDRAHRTLILEEGMKWVQTTTDPEKSQLLGLRGFQLREAARMLGVPPHKLGDLENAHFTNVEEQNIDFVVDCVRPRCVRLEQRFRKQLLTAGEKGKLFFEYNVNGLLRGNQAARFAAYAIGLGQTGPAWMTPNDVRDLENLNPGPKELDRFFVPQNMAPMDAPVTAGAKPATGEPT